MRSARNSKGFFVVTEDDESDLKMKRERPVVPAGMKFCLGPCATAWPLDRFKVVSGRRQARCIPCWNDYQKRWLRERRARRTQEEHEAALAYQRQHYAENRERCIATKMAYKKAKPELNRRWNRRCKLRKAQAAWRLRELAGSPEAAPDTMFVE